MTQRPLPEREIRRHQGPDAPWTYEMLDRRQREIAARVRDGGPGAILLSEVAPVITIGRRTQGSDLLKSEEQLRAHGIETYRVDRGGFATYHGPGQWVLFVVDRLDRLTGDPRGVRKAVNGLLGCALQVGRSFDGSAETRSGPELGAWNRQGKFAALGIQIEQGVLLHGISINAFRTPTSFLGLRPCGLDSNVSFLFESNNLNEIPQVQHEEREKRFQALGAALIDPVFQYFYR
jgi:lipoate-protein ligase B